MVHQIRIVIKFIRQVSVTIFYYSKIMDRGPAEVRRGSQMRGGFPEGVSVGVKGGNWGWTRRRGWLLSGCYKVEGRRISLGVFRGELWGKGADRFNRQHEEGGGDA